MARIAAFIAGASPPLVRTATLISNYSDFQINKYNLYSIRKE
jgi:hypothetical protein